MRAPRGGQTMDQSARAERGAGRSGSGTADLRTAATAVICPRAWGTTRGRRSDCGRSWAGAGWSWERATRKAGAPRCRPARTEWKSRVGNLRARSPGNHYSRVDRRAHRRACRAGPVEAITPPPRRPRMLPGAPPAAGVDAPAGEAVRPADRPRPQQASGPSRFGTMRVPPPARRPVNGAEAAVCSRVP